MLKKAEAKISNRVNFITGNVYDIKRYESSKYDHKIGRKCPQGYLVYQQ